MAGAGLQDPPAGTARVASQQGRGSRATDAQIATRLIIADVASAAVPDWRRTSPVQTWTTTSGIVSALGYVTGGHRWVRWPGLAAFRFDSQEGVVTAYPDPSADRSVVEDTWRRSVLPLAMLESGFEALHASAVETTGGVVAFCAASGTGKSTLACALHTRGFRQWADDAVVFRAGQSGATAFALPFSVRLKSSVIPLAVSTDVPETLRRTSAPLRAICVLSRLGPDATVPVAVERLHGTHALLAALPHAHTFDAGDHDRMRQTFEAFFRVVESVEVIDVRFRPGAKYWPEVLDGVAALVTGS